MKTRIIKTRYWADGSIHKLSKEARYLFIYLLTSPYINLCGIFELPDEYIKLETGLTEKELEKAKEQLIAINKVRFHNGWLYIVNADKHNGYRNSPMNEIAYEKEISLIPSEIKAILDSSMDSSIDTTPIVTINKKQETINKKLEIRKNIEELKKQFPNVDVNGEIDKMMDWLASSGKVKADYLAFARNWLRRVEKESSFNSKKIERIV